mmetsp:Transcript_31178/g.43214  ORF Transcript_31178/g.43214 Transcript_31178/m.43214 type:complete len:120 (+) Transcript_31178:183-542(+)|eukprot:CAMPEP_0196593194 /NCGR_PEP_ID=MMETSP1081-20130531/74977_1 /TAXON_ID=36882 /ORGANISM="Pyramimonas amylifera, Strain CCMP720" /LENGTH=119 /DNA_ID=CAMNT_0041917103 /DNA_START=179 /DNA_END=538 /DNA_ORIENTATION=-
MASATLKYIMLLQKDVPKAVRFYNEGLGLKVNCVTERWAELQSGNFKIALKAAEGEAFISTGYSPFLSFDVDDMDATVQKLLQLGASLDGPIKYPTHGKVAALRAPDGHMIGLHEPSVD